MTLFCAGKWANEVSHPSGGITKEYVVTTSDYPNKQQLKGIAEGCLVDGTEVKPIAVQLETSDPHLRNKLRIVLAEGKNREVRSHFCCAACNHHSLPCMQSTKPGLHRTHFASCCSMT